MKFGLSQLDCLLAVCQIVGQAMDPDSGPFGMDGLGQRFYFSMARSRVSAFSSIVPIHAEHPGGDYDGQLSQSVVLHTRPKI